RLPHAAARAAEVERQRLVGMARHRRDPPAAKRPDLAPLERVVERRIKSGTRDWGLGARAGTALGDGRVCECEKTSSDKQAAGGEHRLRLSDSSEPLLYPAPGRG